MSTTTIDYGMFTAAGDTAVARAVTALFNTYGHRVVNDSGQPRPAAIRAVQEAVEGYGTDLSWVYKPEHWSAVDQPESTKGMGEVYDTAVRDEIYRAIEQGARDLDLTDRFVVRLADA